MDRVEAPDLQEVAEVVAYHEDMIEALIRYFKDGEKPNNSRYFGVTELELGRILQRRIAETELRSILQLLVSLEAALRVDYLARVRREERNTLSRECQSLYRGRGERPRLDDLLKLWMAHHPESGEIVSQFCVVTRFRNWLAHGRYGRPETRYSYLEIEAFATTFLGTLPLQK